MRRLALMAVWMGVATSACARTVHAPRASTAAEPTPRRTEPRRLALRVQQLDVSSPRDLDVEQFARAQLEQLGHRVTVDAPQVAEVLLGPPGWRGSQSCVPITVRLVHADGTPMLLPVEWTNTVCGEATRPRHEAAQGFAAVLPFPADLAVESAGLAVDAARRTGAFATQPGAPDIGRPVLESMLAQGLKRVSLGAQDPAPAPP